MSEEEWLSARSHSLGGSEIGAVAGLSKYNSPYNIWASKTAGIKTFEGNEATELGNLLEAPVAERYALVKNAAVVEWPVILRSKEYPFLSANVDRFVVSPCIAFPAGKVSRYTLEVEPPGIIGLLECKTGAIASPGKPQEWDNNQIPSTYSTQGMFYCGITGLPWADYAALIGGKGVLFRHQPFDPEFYNNLVLIARNFWECHVATGTPPPIDASDSTADALKALYPVQEDGKVVTASDTFTGLYWEYQKAKKESEAAEERRKKARNAVVAWIGDAESVVLPNGDPLCTYRKSKDSVGIDKDALRRDHPDIWQSYEVFSNGSRRLLDKS